MKLNLYFNELYAVITTCKLELHDFGYIENHNVLIYTEQNFKCNTRSENQSNGVTTICLTQCNTSPSHRVDQVVDCGLWDVGPLLFNGCVKLLDIGRNWNTLSYTPIQSIPNMLNG